MKKLLPLIILLFVFNAFGQIKATTDDGKKVILKADKTWEYEAIEKPVVKEVSGRDLDAAISFAKNNAEKLKKSEFETEAEYKTRLIEIFRPSQKDNEFSIRITPEDLSYNAEKQSFHFYYFASRSNFIFVHRFNGYYSGDTLSITFPVSSQKAAVIKDKIEVVVYGFPVELTYGNALKLLPSRIQFVDKNTGEVYFEQVQSNFLTEKK